MKQKIKYQITEDIKEGYYKGSDGIFKMKDSFEKVEDKVALEIVSKMQELSSQLYNHLGGL
jgi:hypothetical protein